MTCISRLFSDVEAEEDDVTSDVEAEEAEENEEDEVSYYIFANYLNINVPPLFQANYNNNSIMCAHLFFRYNKIYSNLNFRIESDIRYSLFFTQ